ncbi:transferase, TIGR04331 family [Leptospira weilii serovar Ranarum str. ICFT]|uniref:Transferase, TIGR04331 family n=1 Tax=Leptospira weilii serovar Ranarum str. ICFT TaxID=1218598 RepID=N1WGG4_9LEPT|nr:LIC12162 family protein [Leptospira weilii]EMY76224.1 transferase, TIGR04331 family [Leptospira weilii serovar Ranarum str. ICFT]
MQDLILTGFTDFFPDEKQRVDAVYLANFCFLNNPSVNFEDHRKFRFIDSPYKNWTDVEKASSYIDSFYDRVLPAICERMNEIFKVDKSEKYWSIVLIRYLHSFIHIYYDRYLRLLSLREQRSKFRIKILNYNEVFIPNEDYFFNQATDSHHYNLNLLSDFIRENEYGNNVLRFDVKAPSERANAVVPFWRKIKQKGKGILKNKYFALLKYRYNAIDSIRLGLVYGLSEKQKLSLLPSNKLSRIYNKSKDEIQIESIFPNKNQSFVETLKFDTQSEFETVFKKNFFRYLPDEFKVLKMAKRNPYKIWIGMDVYNSNRFLVADTLERGGSWYSVQHGGGYGQISNFPLGKIEYCLSDGFISWGWKYDQSGYKNNIIPLSSPSLSILGKHEKRNNEILIVTHTYFVYLIRLQSIMLPEMILDYTDNLISFCNHINQNDAYEYKVKTTNMSWANHNYLKNKLPKGVEILNPDSFDIVKRMKNSSLSVFDHLGTAYLQALAMNVPTLLFWNPNHFKESSEFKIFLDLLREVEILFDDWKAAANKLDEILKIGIEKWWFQDRIQIVRDKFLLNHAKISSEWQGEWKQFLAGLVNI